MTAEEVYNATPWEIDMRLKGYIDRQRAERIFLTSIITLPVCNSGFSRPEKGYKLKDFIPDIDEKPITKKELDFWRNELDMARKEQKERRLNHG